MVNKIIPCKPASQNAPTPITRAYLAIQCTAANGQRGTFLYVPGESGELNAISPVFSDGCIPLYAWCEAHGWTLSAYDFRHPVGVYERTSDAEG